MGKVKTTVESWPNVITHQDSSYRSQPLLRIPSNDNVLKELENELFQDVHSPMNIEIENPEADLVSRYISIFEKEINSVPVIDLVSDENLDNFHLNSFSSSGNGMMNQTASSLCYNSSPPTPMQSPPTSPNDTTSPSFDSKYLNNVNSIIPRTLPQIPQNIHTLNTALHTSPQIYSQILNNPSQQAFVQLPPGLSPLSCGGFILNPYSTLLPSPHLPTQTSSSDLPSVYPVSTHFVPSQMQSFTTTVKPVAPSIASRQEKLDKYRQKRSKRNYSRAADQSRRERAQSRSRDEFGHFINEKESILVDLDDVKTKLEQSQEESNQLKSRLEFMEKQMEILRQKAEQASVTQEVMLNELTKQKNMNNALLQENSLLWTSVPQNEVFSTVKQNIKTKGPSPSPFVNVKPFEQKIDLSTAAHDLIYTDSKHLEAARLEEEGFEKRWDGMTYIAGAF